MLQVVVLHDIIKRHSSSVLKKINTEKSRKESHVAKAIKKLNKENKSLFGSLLETLPEKRKRQKQKGESNAPNIEIIKESKSDNLEESWWLSRMLPSKSRCSYSKLNMDCRTDTATGKMLDNDTSEGSYVSKKTSVSKKVKMSAAKEPKIKIGIEPNIEKSAVFNRKEDMSNSTILPEIIIRNIPTFPLLNEAKNCESTPSKIVMSVSASDAENTRRELLMYPSVTKVLNATMSESSLAALKRWRQKMIAELGEEGFQKHHRALLDAGALFHNTVQSYLSGELQKVDPQIEGCWESLETVLSNVNNVRVLESHVVHSSLLYRGVIDCVAQYKKSSLIIEWKKSDKQKPELEKTYDAPIQLSAYMGALNYDLKYEFQVEGGLVVVAYTDGSPAHIYPMSISECQKYWNFWLKRLQQYWLQQ